MNSVLLINSGTIPVCLNHCQLKSAFLSEGSQRRKSVSDGGVLVIIPSAGLNLDNLSRCINSVLKTAQPYPLRVVVVLCPANPKVMDRVRNLCDGRVYISPLSGPFNYCRSINHGLTFLDPSDEQVLFLNDDVTFFEGDVINELRNTLDQMGWACVGPYIQYNPDVHDDTWPSEKSNAIIIRQSGPIRTNTPVSGCCAMWSRAWLDMIGPLDEEFGVGWGMDEADLCLRAIRLGGQYGRNDSVSIKHTMHATFGHEYTKYSGQAHMRSLKYFKEKYGDDVEEWGRSHHWLPLPKIHVIVTSASLSSLSGGIQSVRERLARSMFGAHWSLSLCTHEMLSTDVIVKSVSLNSRDNIVMRPSSLLRCEPHDCRACTGCETAGSVTSYLQYPVVCLAPSECCDRIPNIPAAIAHVRDAGFAGALLRCDGSITDIQCGDLRDSLNRVCSMARSHHRLLRIP
jgi:GT2 family glycosyltransferase